ncbi:MAG TPA: DUF1189 family protein [Pyrinomonadaceae bacterium]
MKRYSIFHAFVLSFFSKSFYQDVGQRWRGTGLAFLLVVLALVWIPTTIKLHWTLSRFVKDYAPRITKQIPAITISNGKVSTDVPTPYFINDPDTGTPMIIIDTTGQYESLDNTPAKVLLTRSKIMTQQRAETRVYDLSDVKSFYVDHVQVEGWLAFGARWFALVAYPLVLVFSFIFRTIQVLIYALFGLVFASLLNAKLSYQTLMRLAAVSLTPVLLLNLLLEFVPLRIPGWWLLGISIALVYLFLAVKWNAEPLTVWQDQPMVAPPFMPGPPAQ